MSVIDHTVKGFERLATQFNPHTQVETETEESTETNLQKFLRIILSEADVLEVVFQDLVIKRRLDGPTNERAFGAQLDIIGIIVGQPRSVFDAGEIQFFGMGDALGGNDAGAFSFGSVSSSNGGRFRNVTESTSGFKLLDDIEYRAFIKAKIQRNHSTATINQIIAAAIIIADAPTAELTEGFAGANSYQVKLGKVLTENEILFLDVSELIPETAGISVDYVGLPP